MRPVHSKMTPAQWVFFSVRTFSLLWEKRERQARFLGPWGPYHSAQSEKPVNESSERMGQSSLPRSLGSRDCARDCGRELASESFLRSHLSSASFSSSGTRRRQPALRPEQSRGPFPSRPEPGRQRPGAYWERRERGLPLSLSVRTFSLLGEKGDRSRSSGPLGALLSSPALDVRLPTALQVLQVLQTEHTLGTGFQRDLKLTH